MAHVKRTPLRNPPQRKEDIKLSTRSVAWNHPFTRNNILVIAFGIWIKHSSLKADFKAGVLLTNANCCFDDFYCYLWLKKDHFLAGHENRAPHRFENCITLLKASLFFHFPRITHENVNNWFVESITKVSLLEKILSDELITNRSSFFRGVF